MCDHYIECHVTDAKPAPPWLPKGLEGDLAGTEYVACQPAKMQLSYTTKCLTRLPMRLGSTT